MSAITTKLNKPVIVHDAHMYRFDRRSADGGKFWRCILDGCTGRIKTDDSDIFIEFRNQVHNHPSNPDEIKVRSVVTTMKNRARNETTSMMNIYRTETATLATQPNVAACMPTFAEVSLL
jgi:hypothetical protein